MSSWQAPADLDPEVEALCRAMNSAPGIMTTNSCCGHGEQPYRIWFISSSLDALPPLLYWFMACHCGCYGWRVEVTTDCGMKPVDFMVEGPKGQEAYDQSVRIARLLEAGLRHG